MDGDNITNMMSFLFVSIIATETYTLHNHSTVYCMNGQKLEIKKKSGTPAKTYIIATGGSCQIRIYHFQVPKVVRSEMQQ